MKITIRNAYDEANYGNNAPDVFIVIDVFRASTTSVAIIERLNELNLKRKNETSITNNFLIANSIETLQQYHSKGYFVISEVFNIGIDNSPTMVKTMPFESGKVILKTTNLTTAIAANAHHIDGSVSGSGSNKSKSKMIIGCFNNLWAIIDFIRKNNFQWIEILPAGQMAKKAEGIEDTYCAEVYKYLLEENHTKEFIQNNFQLDNEKLQNRIFQKTSNINPSSHRINDLTHACKLSISDIVPFVTQIDQDCFQVS